MTQEQIAAVRNILEYVYEHENRWKAHHGDCVGADAGFHGMAKLCGAYTIVHPPIDNKLRAYCDGDSIRDPKPYHARNRDIADDSSLLLATPKDTTGQGGTWYTIAYAVRVGVPVVVVHPEGSLTYHNYGRQFLLGLKER